VFYTKPKLTEAQYRADVAACVEIAKTGYLADKAGTPTVYYPQRGYAGLAGAATAGFVEGVREGNRREDARSTAVACLVDKGYRTVQMSQGQIELYDRLSPEQRIKAEIIWSTGGDINSLQSNQP